MNSTEKNAEALAGRADFRGHLTPHFKVDPSAIIHEEYLRLYGPELAQRFRSYREQYMAVSNTRQGSPYPITVNIGLRDACNLRCPHCYRQHNPEQYTVNRLTKAEAFNLIDQCAAMGTPAILFGTASEHFTHPDAVEILAYACSKPELLDIFLATNALMLDEAKIEALLAMRLTRITVSIDAVTPETYAKVRGGDYDRLLRNLNHLLNRRAELGKKLPVLRVTFVSYNLNSHEQDEFSRLWLNRADITDIQKIMDIRIINDLQDATVERLDCAYPWNMLYVRWDGEVFPCCCDFGKHITVGNIHQQSLEQIWNGPRMAELRRTMTTPGEYPKACVNCVSSLGSENPIDELG